MRRRQKQYVLCVRNRGYKASLEARKIYETLPDAEASSHGMIRVIDESGEDYLYDANRFVPIAIPEKARRAFSRPTARKRDTAAPATA